MILLLLYIPDTISPEPVHEILKEIISIYILWDKYKFPTLTFSSNPNYARVCIKCSYCVIPSEARNLIFSDEIATSLRSSQWHFERLA